METRTFNEIISKVIAQGASSIEIQRSKGHCGCVSQGDIIAVEFGKESFKTEDGKYIYVYRASLCRVFDEKPIIKVERIWRNAETGRCTSNTDIKEFEYAR